MGNEDIANNSDNFIEISIDQIDEMMRENKKDTREGRSITQSTYNGESFQKSGKFEIGRFYQDYLERDPLIFGFNVWDFYHIMIMERKCYPPAQGVFEPRMLLDKLTYSFGFLDINELRSFSQMRTLLTNGT